MQWIVWKPFDPPTNTQTVNFKKIQCLCIFISSLREIKSNLWEYQGWKMSDCPCYVLVTSHHRQVILISIQSNVATLRWFPNRNQLKKKKLQDCAVSLFLCEFLSLGRPGSAFSEIWQVAVLIWRSAAGFSKETKSEQDSENKKKKAPELWI